MENRQSNRRSFDRLEQALSSILGAVKSTSKLSQVLAYAAVNGIVSYQETREIIKDDPEDVLLLADKWRLLLPVRTTKSAGWEDRVLMLRDGEKYEIPNLIRYLVKDALDTGIWDPEKTINELFKEFEDPDREKVPGLVRSIFEKATDYKITGNQIKKICIQSGLSNRVDGLIAELKAAGIISPRLGSIPDVLGAQSPIYELNPSVII
ncbi:MAG: hypothetical protein JRI26_11065 [Deltaproteobacteria bacterium]|nr:hypothetical protein [Deltaproteobacteria bacterium]